MDHSQKHPPRYTLTLYVAEPGTPLKNPKHPDLFDLDDKGQIKTSAAGHVWYAVSDGISKKGYGFGPIADGKPFGKGKVNPDEFQIYHNPVYEKTIEITKEQFEKLTAFGKYPEKHGFDMNYLGNSNSCVDFTFNALAHAGLYNRKNLGFIRDEGTVKVRGNIEKFNSITGDFPYSDKNQTITRPPPDKTLLQKLLTENQQQQPSQQMNAAKQPAAWTPESFAAFVQNAEQSPQTSRLAERISQLDAAEQQLAQQQQAQQEQENQAQRIKPRSIG